MMTHASLRSLLVFTCFGLAACSSASTATAADDGVLPRDASGRPLNLDFETGTLEGWTAEGKAFAAMPVEGDVVARRRSDMKSRHQGRFWVGSFERAGDEPQGRLTSASFVVAQPWASFLVAGGTGPTTCVELRRADGDALVARFSGENSEELKRVAVDLRPHLGKSIYVRLIDTNSGGWGHINFDDFRLHPTKPDVPVTPGLDVYQHAGLPPEKAAEAMTLPKGFRATLFAGEPDVHQPIAFTIDHRGRLWVAEAYSYPIKVAKEKARDRILIFEDSDGDGRFDDRKVFAEGLNLVSGLELGFGGVYVGAAPELLFIPDRNGDDRPDGPPEVLLDGWGMQDTHETLNSFNWGPDGWLYGCHGVFTHSRVGKPGTPAAERVPINAGIWRWHPTKKEFEVFAHGTSNPWGVDFDARGEAFLTSCVIPHLYHVIPGARYERQAGSHFDPHTYQDIKTIADHRHYLGFSPHGGNGRSDAAGGGHAHSGAMIYQGATWPEQYRGRIFMNNIHGARINQDRLVRSGSGYRGTHAEDFLLANDTWSQIISLKSGPDGNVFLIDWYDGQQCHLTNPDRHDRSNGRIYKVSLVDSKPVKVDLKSLSSLELAKLHAHRDEWYVRMSRRLLQERGRDAEVENTLAKAALETTAIEPALRALWALHAVGGLTPERIQPLIAQGGDVAVWTLRLALEDRRPTPEILGALAETAASGSPSDRLAVASCLQRIPVADRPAILAVLLRRGEDASDHNLPLMIWYAAEPLAEVDASKALELALAGKIPVVRDFMIRRIASEGSSESIALLIDALGRDAAPASRLAILSGINTALKGRRNVPMPPTWPRVFRAIDESKSTTPAIRSQATALALTFGDTSARSTLRAVLADDAAALPLRRDALDALLKARDAELPPVLHRLLESKDLRGPALRGLAAIEHPETARRILERFTELGPDDRRDAINTLAARAATARELLTAIESSKVDARELSADLVRQLRNLGDDALTTRIGKVWGQVRPTTADRAKRIADFRARITRADGPAPDASLGRAVFAKSCRQCHGLFGEGGKVGPDLTGSNRRDLNYLLENVLDPSALIGKDYQAQVIATTDGRTLTGIIRGEDADAITLLTANETVILPKGEVEERKPSELSMMPEDLWANLSDHEIRSLVAYLASPGQVPIAATPENIADFFNGRDLTAWRGEKGLWRVENGEIIGKTVEGLAHNTWLRSDYRLQDFRLRFEVKLVDDRGNSGVQFRSLERPDGEVAGYQADIGPGWWGKLYEEHGRALLWDRSGEAHVRKGEWNEYEVVAVGSKIITKINGKVCVDLDDPTGAKSGIVAFQLHSGGPTEVRFRNLRVELLAPKPASR
ncbi:MAG: family 16 glycoside hydrolase [Isosphaeraceae bacterium]|nr:family 16 glycoside hydrolase [Isosphaeraceae bacterium]